MSLGVKKGGKLTFSHCIYKWESHFYMQHHAALYNMYLESSHEE